MNGVPLIPRSLNLVSRMVWMVWFTVLRATLKEDEEVESTRVSSGRRVVRVELQETESFSAMVH